MATLLQGQTGTDMVGVLCVLLILILHYNVLYKPTDLELLMVSVSKTFTHNCTASRKTCISVLYIYTSKQP